MKTWEELLKELEGKEKELIAVGASIASGCQYCSDYHFVKVFDEGVRLSRLCSKKLDEAEKKVEILLKESNGRLVPKAFALGEEED